MRNSSNRTICDVKNSAEKFLQDYAELLKDKSFMDTAKLYNEISPELRAMALGYIVGLLRSYNIDTKKILGY